MPVARRFVGRLAANAGVVSNNRKPKSKDIEAVALASEEE